MESKPLEKLRLSIQPKHLLSFIDDGFWKDASGQIPQLILRQVKAPPNLPLLAPPDQPVRLKRVGPLRTGDNLRSHRPKLIQPGTVSISSQRLKRGA